MPKPVTVTIDSIEKEDVLAMFNDICDNYLKINHADARRKFLGFFGKDQVVLSRPITIEDVMKLALKSKASISVSVTYNTDIVSAEESYDLESTKAPDIHETMPETTTNRIMENQVKGISNPELEDIVKEAVPSVVNIPEMEKPAVTPAKVVIPKFKV